MQRVLVTGAAKGIGLAVAEAFAAEGAGLVLLIPMLAALGAGNAAGSRIGSAFAAIGVPLGIAMGMSPFVRGIFDPPIEFYRPLPPLAEL